MHSKKGLTLMEVMVILIIVGILTAIIVPLITKHVNSHDLQSPLIRELVHQVSPERVTQGKRLKLIESGGINSLEPYWIMQDMKDSSEYLVTDRGICRMGK